MTYPNSTVQDFKWELLQVYKDSQYSMTIPKIETNNKEYIPKAKDKLYFYPGCNVPRYKVREWGKKNDISITIKEDNATVKFGSRLSISKCLSYDTHTRMDKFKYLAWLDSMWSRDDGNIKLMCEEILKSASNYVYLQKYGSGSNISMFMNLKDYHGNPYDRVKDHNITHDLAEADKDANGWYRSVYVTDNNYQILSSLLASPDVYSQQAVIGLINEDAMVIDQEMYGTLRNMFASNSDKDKLMALEIIGNCNIDPSLHHVLLLIKEYHNQIYAMSESKHVNFKSLLEYIGVGRMSMGNINDDLMITCLMDKDVLTMQIVKELAEGVKDIWKDQYDTTHFKINTITVSDDVKRYFKEKELQEEPVVN